MNEKEKYGFQSQRNTTSQRNTKPQRNTRIWGVITVAVSTRGGDSGDRIIWSLLASPATQLKRSSVTKIVLNIYSHFGERGFHSYCVVFSFHTNQTFHFHSLLLQLASHCVLHLIFDHLSSTDGDHFIPSSRIKHPLLTNQRNSSLTFDPKYQISVSNGLHWRQNILGRASKYSASALLYSLTPK